jgi:ABC-type nitrate/sulfonate/bicarbonate transport system substrate-binding protein
MKAPRLFTTFALALGLATVASAQAPGASAAAQVAPLRVVAFAGGWNLPLWAAQRQGFFEQQGLAVQLSYTAGSAALVDGLMKGRYDIALAAIDNLVAYQEGQGDGPPLEDPDLVAVMGVDHGFLSVVAQAPLRTMADLRGRTLAVDSLNTGFAFVLRALLQASGVADTEVTLVRGGATELRFAGLVAGTYDATLLRTPFDIVAAERGLHVLATADTLGPYLGTSGFVRRSWARGHEAALIGFLRAYRQAMQWLVDPANRRGGEALLMANLHDMTPALAQRAAATLLAERGGLLRDLGIDPAGLGTVLALRAKYGQPPRPLGDVDRYVDLSYRARALAAER